MTFSEHMKRIIYLAEQSIVHSQAEKFEPAAADLLGISNHCDEAIQQLDELSFIKEQSTRSANSKIGGPKL